MSVIGFDIGSESALIAIARNNGIDIILNEASSRSTPVLVSFMGKQRHIGAAAEPLQRSNYKNTIGNLKRFLGRNYSEPSVQRELKEILVAHKAMPNDEIGFLVNYNDAEEYFTPTQCMAMVLGKLKSIVDDSTSTSATANVVISVPIYYTQKQRKAVMDAAEIAGIRCLKVFNEPTACALAYGYPKSVKKQLDAEKPQTILFADMGYSDFTVSVVEFYQGKMVVKGVAYDRHCGGKDIDKALVDHLIQEFKSKTKLDCSTNPKAVMSLYRVAEKAKKTLSPYGVDNVAVNCECLYQDRDLATKLDISQFNSLCSHLIPKIASTVQSALANAKVSIEAINDVELIGGSLRVRWAKEALAIATNRKVDDLSSHMNMDEACARGCALMSAILAPNIRMHEFQINDYVPYGIEMAVEGETEKHIIFERGSVTPNSKPFTFIRSDPLTIHFGYDEASKELLPEGADMKIADISVKPVDGALTKIRVTMEHDFNGCFKIKDVVHMKEVEIKKEGEKKEGEDMKEGEGKEGEKKEDEGKGGEGKESMPPMFTAVSIPYTCVLTGHISIEDMVSLQAKEARMARADREIVERDAKKNEVETYVYDMRDKLHSDTLKPFITASDVEVFSSKLGEVESWLYSDEGCEGTLGSYQGKLDELKKMGDEVIFRMTEKENRPAAISALKGKLEKVASFISARGVDENYSHITATEWNTVNKIYNDCKSWLHEEETKQDKLPLTSTPTLTCALLKSKKNDLTFTSEPIMKRPKPKESPKKAESKDEGEEKKDNEEKTTEQRSDQNKEAPSGEEKVKSEDIQMEGN